MAPPRHPCIDYRPHMKADVSYLSCIRRQQTTTTNKKEATMLCNLVEGKNTSLQETKYRRETTCWAAVSLMRTY
eukprot:scaffold28926_cov23-Prasinocladus_malaysianus.AAC.1